ncbi:hypothetical protein [Afifella pfennigii]|nr:hypothetical protein [Afifella pfennigii]
MPDLNEPSCWRAAALTFAVCAGLLLVISLIVSDGATAVVAVS